MTGKGRNSEEDRFRTPVNNFPSWVTLEVINGGSETGKPLAAGPLQDHERLLLNKITNVPEGEERLALNAYFMTEAGLIQLQEWMETGCYKVNVPEEGALLVVAWLLNNGHAEDARKLIEVISPFFSTLRFYPVPMENPQSFSTRISLHNVEETICDIETKYPHFIILAQKEAVNIWNPIHDRIVALFIETIVNDWPCQQYPDNWSERAKSLIDEFTELRKVHKLCSKMEHKKGHSFQLRKFLGICACNPKSLSSCDVGFIRHILNCYKTKRGLPNEARCNEVRSCQKADVNNPTHLDISKIVVSRLDKHSMNDGVEDVTHLHEPVSHQEAAESMIPAGTSIPFSIQKKVNRCRKITIDELLTQKNIDLGILLAQLVPERISELRTSGIIDFSLRQLYASIYHAFRRRRSLLLLNLEEQVQIAELPWISAMEQFRTVNLTDQELAVLTLEEISMNTLISYPHVVFPQKLLQRLSLIIKTSGLEMPIVKDDAATKTPTTFVKAAYLTADLLHGSLYATYYDINYDQIQQMAEQFMKDINSVKSYYEKTNKTFVELCASRAGVLFESYSPATNGMIIEQQQILTTQNLAVLFVKLNLKNKLCNHLGLMAKKCFRWICKRKQDNQRLHNKNKITAYAWRQMIFYLALLPDDEVRYFIQWAEEHLCMQTTHFQKKFRPILNGLFLASENQTIKKDSVDARRFLGWGNN